MIFGNNDEIAINFEVDEVGNSNFLFGRCQFVVNSMEYFQNYSNISINIVLNYLRRRVRPQPLAMNNPKSADELYFFGCLINGISDRNTIPVSPLSVEKETSPEIRAFIDDYDAFLDRVRDFFSEGNSIEFGGELSALGVRCFLFERDQHEWLVISEDGGASVDLHKLRRGAYGRFIDSLPEELSVA